MNTLILLCGVTVYISIGFFTVRLIAHFFSSHCFTVSSFPDKELDFFGIIGITALWPMVYVVLPFVGLFKLIAAQKRHVNPFFWWLIGEETHKLPAKERCP